MSTASQYTSTTLCNDHSTSDPYLQSRFLARSPSALVRDHSTSNPYLQSRFLARSPSALVRQRDFSAFSSFSPQLAILSASNFSFGHPALTSLETEIFLLSQLAHGSTMPLYAFLLKETMLHVVFSFQLPKRCSKTQPRRFRSSPVSLPTTLHFQQQPLDCPTHPLLDVLQPSEQGSHKKKTPSSTAVEISSDKSSSVHGIPSISPPGLHFIQIPSKRQPSDTSLVSRLPQVYDNRPDDVFALPNHPSAAHCSRSSISTHTSNARESGGFNKKERVGGIDETVVFVRLRQRRKYIQEHKTHSNLIQAEN